MTTTLKCVQPGHWENDFPNVCLFDLITEIDTYFTPSLSTQVNLKEYADKLRAHATIITVIHEGEIVGLLAAYLNEGKESYASCACVKPSMRGKGCFSRMLCELIRLAQDMNCTSVACRVNADDEAILRTYRKNGFTIGTAPLHVHGQQKRIACWINSKN